MKTSRYANQGYTPHKVKFREPPAPPSDAELLRRFAQELRLTPVPTLASRAAQDAMEHAMATAILAADKLDQFTNTLPQPE